MEQQEWPERICVLDTETTGLLEDQKARVIEIGAIILNNKGNELASFSTLVHPSMMADDGERIMSRFSGIDPEWLIAAPGEWEAILSFFVWLQGWRRDGSEIPIFSFNLEFDRWMLARMEGFLTPPTWGDCIMLMAHDHMRRFDALEERYDGSLKWPKLEEAASFYGVVSYKPEHRALPDARTSAGVLYAILSRQTAEAKCP